tara:strand:+ start:3112 stop:3987 length:876 start_codon:yes stop_codon:yes gene_type:complete
MLITNNDTRTRARTTRSNSLTKWLLLITVNLLIFTQSFANEVAAVHEKEQGVAYSISQGVFKKELNNEQRKKIVESNKRAKSPDQLNKKATAKTRAVMLNSQKKLINKSVKNLVTQSNADNYYADFAIYGATSFLEDDYDGDGFYQTFSVSFDVDIYSYTENKLDEVYALLYLSKNGGPWTHYFTTDTFIIEGESDLDEYEVITTFLSGYSSDYYDVLIDLYQVGYSDIATSFSSDDSNALYALPLESADYDEPYIEVVQVIEVSSGGGFSVITLFIILISAAFRFRTQRQ